MAAGTINTVVGSGTLITFPTLLAFGIPPVTANVSNTIGLAPGSLSAAIGYRATTGGPRATTIGPAPGSLSGEIGYRRELEGQRARFCRLGRGRLVGGITGALLLL